MKQTKERIGNRRTRERKANNSRVTKKKKGGGEEEERKPGGVTLLLHAGRRWRDIEGKREKMRWKGTQPELLEGKTNAWVGGE